MSSCWNSAPAAVGSASTTGSPSWWGTPAPASAALATEALPVSRLSAEVRARAAAGEGERQQRGWAFPSTWLKKQLLASTHQSHLPFCSLLLRYPEQPCKRLSLAPQDKGEWI